MSEPPPFATPQHHHSRVWSLGGWSTYFIGKLLLYWYGYIGFHALENLLFAVFVAAPSRGRLRRWLQRLIALPLAVVLLYYDSFLPPFRQFVKRLPEILSFSQEYLLELSGRIIDFRLLAGFLILWALIEFLRQWVRIGGMVIACLTALLLLPLVTQNYSSRNIAHPELAEVTVKTQEPTTNPTTSSSPSARPTEAVDFDKLLADFFASEARRKVTFVPAADASQPFDIVFLHICSLSWDDIRVAGLEQHPIWQRLDLLFTRFNSAASYSGPAAIRFLRATCGQTSHQALYSPANPGCYLMKQLADAGFESELAMNHDGHFYEFLQIVQQQYDIQNRSALSLVDLPITQRSFDDSPIFDDYAVLARWMENQPPGGKKPTALFYNTVSLHDGNYLNEPGASRDSLKTYGKRATTLLDGVVRFFDRLESSGRRTIVVVASEHGAALEGDRMQFPGLREIPSPAITLVPLGIRVIGPGVSRPSAPIRITEPTSYLAMSHVIGGMINNNPFVNADYRPETYLRDLPQTQFVSENEDATVMAYDNGYVWRQGKDPWTPYMAGSR